MAEQASERFGVRAVSAEQLESKVLQQVRGCIETVSCVFRISFIVCWYLSAVREVPTCDGAGSGTRGSS